MSDDITPAERLHNAAMAMTFYEAKLDNAPLLDEIVEEVRDIAQELERVSKTTYAMVVVIQAPDPEDAHLQVAGGCKYADFVGAPWQVAAAEDYDTETCLRERGEI